MIIALGADHAAYKLKDEIKKHLLDKGYEVIDFGTNGPESVDYPIFAKKVGESVSNHESDFGVVCCWSAEGISIACNKIKGIRCGIGYNDEVSSLMRKHNDANVIAFAEKFMDVKDVLHRVDIFLSTPFEGGRHSRRVDLIKELEK